MYMDTIGIRAVGNKVREGGQMIEKKDLLLSETVLELEWGERRKVVNKLISDWDKFGEGCFAEFILKNYRAYWMDRVMRN